MSRVDGVKEMKRNIETLKRQHSIRVEKGLVAAGLLIKKDAQKNTPVREGSLRSSGYIATPTAVPDAGGGFTGEGSAKLSSDHNGVLQRSQAATAARSTGFIATIAVGFTAFYALIVHENPNAGARGFDPSKDRPGMKASEVHSRKGGWKFLERALNRSHGQIKRSIAAAAKLPAGPVRS